jgi:DNA-binding PadR family transcriptional regulator
MLGLRHRWHSFDGEFGGAGGGRRGTGRGQGGPGRGGGKPFGFGGGGFPFRRGSLDFFQSGARARRGDIRAAILALLAEQPRNGYQIIQEVEQRSGGVWRPSPGSVYPALQQLQDEGLVRVEEGGGNRSFRLTAEGEAYVKAHPDEVASPWESVGGQGREQMVELWQQIGQLASAVKQVAHSGSAQQVGEAKKILGEARRSLYRLLAEAGDDEG